jgi:hypothetical protein
MRSITMWCQVYTIDATKILRLAKMKVKEREQKDLEACFERGTPADKFERRK